MESHETLNLGFQVRTLVCQMRKGQKYYYLNHDDLFVENSKSKKETIKRYLIKERGHKCESCKHTRWMKKLIPIQMHHKNGKKKDCRKENLELICPNCHAQTDNWTYKNSIGASFNSRTSGSEPLNLGANPRVPAWLRVAERLCRRL